MCVWSIGPPAVRMRTMSKLANVTISENSAVMAMMFRIIGSVTYRVRGHQFAPSTAAASGGFGPGVRVRRGFFSAHSEPPCVSVVGIRRSALPPGNHAGGASDYSLFVD